jgi:hypothetical protein
MSPPQASHGVFDMIRKVYQLPETASEDNYNTIAAGW